MYNVSGYFEILSREGNAKYIPCAITTSPSLPGPEYLSRYGDSLRAGRAGDRIPVGARYSAPVHGAHPASYTKGTGSFPGVKRPGRGFDHPSPYSAEVKERVELYIYSPSGPLLPVKR
jgi:hypothetical protein